MPDDDAYDPTAKGEQVPFTRSMRPPVTAEVSRVDFKTGVR